MILGTHFIFSAYGFWLPNDPRGSWSEVVREYEIARFGPATKATTTRSVAARSHDHAKRIAAKRALKYPPVHFTGKQAQLIGEGFREACQEAGYRALAFAIMPDHAHLVLQRHTRDTDQIASHLKAKATKALNDAGLNPMTQFESLRGKLPSPWARNYWSVYIFDDAHMHLAIRYVNDNPLKAGLPAQKWKFVRPYAK